MAELQDPNSTVMGSMPVKTFYSGLLLEKKLFQMLLAPLCPRVTRSSARSRGARFSFQLLKSWVQCRLPANWVRFRLLLIAIGLQSLSMKICMLQSPLCPRETGSPGRLSGDWLLIFFLDGLGSIPGSSELFYLFPVVEKDFLFLLPFCPRETASPTRIFFGS